MTRKKYKANLVLALSALSLAAVTPFSSTFWGAMLQHGFLAAVIGGMADWFAVTALFRRPLGIRYRTEIIPRNRERIFSELVAFIGSDLLSLQNIMKIVERYDTSRMLIAYMHENGGMKKTQVFFDSVAADIIEHIDVRPIAEGVQRAFAGDVDKLEIHRLLAAFLRAAMERGYDEKLIHFVIDELFRMVHTEEFKRLLIGAIEEMKTHYAGENPGRHLAGIFLSLSSDKVAAMGQDKLGRFLLSLKDENHALRHRIKKECYAFIDRLEKDETYKRRIDAYILEFASRHIDVNAECASFKEDQLSLLRSGETSPLRRLLDKKLRQLKQEPLWRRKLDRRIKGGVQYLLERQHDAILSIVQERLKSFSNEDFVEFIETKVGDDLQMIRINGSVVGGAVGMLLFALTYLAERMCS